MGIWKWLFKKRNKPFSEGGSLMGNLFCMILDEKIEKTLN